MKTPGSFVPGGSQESVRKAEVFQMGILMITFECYGAVNGLIATDYCR